MIEIATGPVKKRQELFRETAKKMNLHEAIIEKDFWVCCILGILFKSPRWSEKLIFKGGTSLSKVFNVIDRFSEDIDLILDWRELGYSKEDPWAPVSLTKQGKFVELTNEKTIAFLKETLIPELTQELFSLLGPVLKIELTTDVISISYPKAFENPAIIPHIILEIGPLASWTPHGDYQITPYAAECFPASFTQTHVAVRAVTAERTFWEKATILHQEANRPESKSMPQRYSRHYYDLYLMSISSICESAMANISLLAHVVEFKERFYRTPWARLPEAQNGTLQLVPPAYRLPALEQDYAQMKAMIFSENPASFAQIITALRNLEDKINKKIPKRIEK